MKTIEELKSMLEVVVKELQNRDILLAEAEKEIRQLKGKKDECQACGGSKVVKRPEDPSVEYRCFTCCPVQPGASIAEVLANLELVMGPKLPEIALCTNCRGAGHEDYVVGGLKLSLEDYSNRVHYPTCHRCNGTGREVEKCKECNGVGSMDDSEYGHMECPKCRGKCYV